MPRIAACGGSVSRYLGLLAAKRNLFGLGESLLEVFLGLVPSPRRRSCDRRYRTQQATGVVTDDGTGPESVAGQWIEVTGGLALIEHDEPFDHTEEQKP